MKKVFAAGVCVLLCCAACSKKSAVVARIGSDTITTGSLTERMQETSPAYQALLGTPSGKRQFVDMLVSERVVLEAARRDGIDRSKEYRKTVADFKKEQARRQREFEDNFLMESFIKKLQAKELAVTDADVEKYYEEHKNEYLRPVQVMARHILVAERPTAEAALARVKKGEDFAAVAKELSIDPMSAQRGGEIGPFGKGELVPEFENAVFALKVGQVSDIVPTKFGFHIIQKISEKVLKPVPADEARQSIRSMLSRIKFDAWMTETKKKMNVSVNYDRLSQVSLPQSTLALPQGAAAPAEEK